MNEDQKLTTHIVETNLDVDIKDEEIQDTEISIVENVSDEKITE